MRLALACALLVFAQDGALGRWSATVGMPVTVRDLVLPGGELEAVPAERKTPLVLRIDAVQPHGDRFRYDLVFYALDPGAHDLRSALRRKDGSSSADLPPLPFEVATLLPAGPIEPHRPESGRLPSLGGYQTLLWTLGSAWALGLFLFLRAGRRARAHTLLPLARARTLAERLAPLVAAARADALDAAGRAELERALIAWWRKKLALEELDAAAALGELARHPEAGALLAGLEQWLHRPGAPPIDLERLLAPYAELEARAAALEEAR